MTDTVCSGVLFNVTPVNITNGVVPTGTTYSWSAPVGTPTGGVAGSGTSISGTLFNAMNTPQAAVYTVTPTPIQGVSCSGASFTVTVIVNPIPAISTMNYDYL